MIGKGLEDRYLTDEEVKGLCAEAFEERDLSGKRVIALIPDGTRTAPLPLLFRSEIERGSQPVTKTSPGWTKVCDGRSN